MVVPIGLSAGDVVMGIRLLTKAIRIMKDSSSASAQYREYIVYLKEFVRTLQHLQTSNFNGLEQATAERIHALAASAEKATVDVSGNIEPYGVAFGGEDRPNTCTAFMKKMR